MWGFIIFGVGGLLIWIAIKQEMKQRSTTVEDLKDRGIHPTIRK